MSAAVRGVPQNYLGASDKDVLGIFQDININ